MIPNANLTQQLKQKTVYNVNVLISIRKNQMYINILLLSSLG